MTDKQWWHMTNQEIDEGIAFVGCWIASSKDELTEKTLKILQRALLSLRAERAKVKRLRVFVSEVSHSACSCATLTGVCIGRCQKCRAIKALAETEEE